MTETNKHRKYKWPEDIRAKLYFPKVISDKWKKMLVQYTYDKKTVRKICDKWFGSGRVNN